MQGLHPVTFLDPQVGQFGEAYRRVVERGQYGEGWNGILHLRANDHGCICGNCAITAWALASG